MIFNCCLFYYITDGELFYTDTDCYTRALRIIDWLNDFQWQEKIFPYFNPPHGFELHFTRICDVIWLILAAPFMLFLPLKEAVFYGGMLFSPLFMALTLAAVLWGLKPYLLKYPRQYTVFIIFSVICLYNLNKQVYIFDFSRPDHHAVMTFIMSACVAIILRQNVCYHRYYPFILGVLCGCGMWASSAIEGLFIVAMMLMILAFNRIFYKHGASELLYYATGLFLCVLVAWGINPPYHGYTVTDISRLSIVHVTLTAIILSTSSIILFIKSTNKYILAITFILSAFISLAIMVGIFGNVLFTPIYDPFVREHFIPLISEMKHMPLISYETVSFLFGILSITGLLIISPKSSFSVNLCILFICTFIAAFIYQRFYPYFLVVYLSVTGLILFYLDYHAQTNNKLKWVMLGYIVLPFLYINTVYIKPDILNVPPLNSPVLSDIFLAPDILFKYNVDSVGGPYHDNIEGLKDNYNMWFTTDKQELVNLIKKHHVRSIYLPTDASPIMYPAPADNTTKLYGKVLSGQDLYPWMIKIGDRHYEIDYGALN